MGANRDSTLGVSAEDSFVFPVSFAQQRLWFLDRLAPGDPLHNICVAVQLQGALRVPALQQTLNEIVRRHEVPEELPEVRLPEGDPVHLPALLVGSFGIASTSEARRLVGQGGVKVDGVAVGELDLPREALAGTVLQVGKRRFARLTAG